MSRASSLWLALALVAPASLRAQQTVAPGEPQSCILQFEGTNTRTQLVKLPSGRYNAFQGGGVTYHCQGQGNTLVADSAEYYGDQHLLYLIGHVHYSEPRMKLDSQRLTYYTADEHIIAQGGVVATLPSGTTMRGPIAEYWRIIPTVRPVTRMLATGRPNIQLVQRDSSGKPQPPVNVDADRVTMVADSLVYAAGKVLITRPDLIATGDSAFMDTGREFARLMKKPQINGKSERPFSLAGDLIDLYSRQRLLQRVVALGNAHAVSQDLDLRSDTLDLRVRDNKLQRAFAWGASRARAVSPTQQITADSLDVVMPDQQVREVRAVRRAYAQTMPDTLRVHSPERDWLSGDTITAHFDTVPHAADTTSGPRIRELVARGNARSFYQIAASSPTKPAVNYVRGSTITVAFEAQQVHTVTVGGLEGGVYLSPQSPDSTAKRGTTAADSARHARPPHGAPR